MGEKILINFSIPKSKEMKGKEKPITEERIAATNEEGNKQQAIT